MNSSLSAATLTKLRREIIVPQQSMVVLTHGLASNRLDMALFAYRLRKMGYGVINWGYPSIRRTIQDHGDSLANILKSVSHEFDQLRIHLVAHSMGCIVSRCAIDRYLPQNMGRLVMLAPPNGGSFVANRLAPWLGWLSTTLTQLSDDADSFVNQLPVMPEIEFGVLAAKHDRVIERSRTHLVGETDFEVVDTGHGVMPWNLQAVERTHRFLTLGRF